ncbi:hypothetical protein M5C97_17035 [Acidovorax sp. NCPPB 3859]|nr:MULTISPECIES: hypothetical protein [unclassified Acidovorax]MDA8450570.1 hypothetical protein [Acidovorax sp. GBBC 3297]MDA8460063.1 hypothetical protein [Acidovorax sp. GBBC 3333]MDA8465099.1 hypothetical protein [Acidovorax sp. GBBC 3332]MDA8470085.1 hypothetical protein [Acidovorax sp. GBBC 3299]WCM77213.1 hypothetical protein M5C94_16990 [Acidovorax sp. GBBC 712]
MRAATTLLLALASGPALAQTPAPSPAPQAAPQAAPAADAQPGAAADAEPGRRNQRVERIRIEDEGSRVDELRVGGQTQSITVQPKAGTTMPEYEVQPPDGVRARPGSRNGAETITSPRVWNVMKF